MPHGWESRWEETELGLAPRRRFSSPNWGVDLEKERSPPAPEHLEMRAWPHQPIQPHLPRRESAVKQSCDGSSTHRPPWAASALFLAAQRRENGKKPRSISSPRAAGAAPRVLQKTFLRRGGSGTGGDGWPCQGAAGTVRPQFIRRADRAGPSRPPAYQTLGTFPSLQPAARWLWFFRPAPSPHTHITFRATLTPRV